MWKGADKQQVRHTAGYLDPFLWINWALLNRPLTHHRVCLGQPEASFIHCLILSHQQLSRFVFIAPITHLVLYLLPTAFPWKPALFWFYLFLHFFSPIPHLTKKVLICKCEFETAKFCLQAFKYFLYSNSHSVLFTHRHTQAHIKHYCTHALIYWVYTSLPVNKQFRDLTNKHGVIAIHSEVYFSVIVCL